MKARILLLCLYFHACSSSKVASNIFEVQDDEKDDKKDGSQVGIAPKIWGDTQAAEPGQFPYYVQLDWTDDGGFCGGSLIAPDVVLTAAHCLGSGWEDWYLGDAFPDCSIMTLIGPTRRSVEDNGAEWRLVVDIAVPEQTSRATLDNDNDDTWRYDYALLRLEEPYEYPPGNNVELRLNMGADFPQRGDALTLVGLGKGDFPNDTEDDNPPTDDYGGFNPTRVHYGSHPYTYSNRQCGRIWEWTIHDEQICWSDCEGWPDSGVCMGKGDSGGPLVSIDGNVHTQIGVTSYLSSAEGDELQEPDVFSSVGSYDLCVFTKRWVCDEWRSMTDDDYLCREACSDPRRAECTQNAFQKFYYKTNNNDKDIFKTCTWLEGKGDRKKANICKKKIKHLASGDVTEPAQDVCQKSCDSCHPCYENARSKFFTGNYNNAGNPKSMTCKKLRKESDAKRNEYCAMTETDLYGPAGEVCPQTCETAFGDC